MDNEYQNPYNPLLPAEGENRFVNRSMLLDSIIGYLQGNNSPAH